MAEVLFILTTIFVAYVVFVVVDCEKRKKEDARQVAKPTTTKPVAAVTAKPAPKAQTPAEKKTAPAPAVKPTSAARTAPDTLKNPESGEVVKVSNNYRFTKRWVKEALVSEGLLDKVYKNTELDDEATSKIQVALEKLKMMDKYQ